MNRNLFPDDYPLDSAWNGGHYFVRDGAKDGGQLGNRRVFSEDRHGVSDLAIDTGNVEHTHIHTYIAYGRDAFPV